MRSASLSWRQQWLCHYSKSCRDARISNLISNVKLTCFPRDSQLWSGQECEGNIHSIVTDIFMGIRYFMHEKISFRICKYLLARAINLITRAKNLAQKYFCTCKYFSVISLTLMIFFCSNFSAYTYFQVLRK